MSTDSTRAISGLSVAKQIDIKLDMWPRSLIAVYGTIDRISYLALVRGTEPL